MFSEHEILRRLERIETLLRELLAKDTAMASALDDQIAALQTAVTNETTVEQSAVTLISGVPGLIADAVAKAIAAGATDAQLQALTDLGASITTSSASLAAAVTANTPAAPTPATT